MDKVEKELDKELVGKALQRCGSAKKEKKLDFDWLFTFFNITLNLKIFY